MNQLDRFRETISSYRKHGWQLRRVLISESTADALRRSGELDFDGIEPEGTPVDALWFARPSHAGREAWELRLIGDSPYALFEAFDADCDEDLREEKLREMQTRLIEYATRD
jgi:hypothetical protein